MNGTSQLEQRVAPFEASGADRDRSYLKTRKYRAAARERALSRSGVMRHADPAFVPSVRLLVERERYSLTDIALMFGVSRESVRLWCQKYGIDHPDAAHGGRGLNCVRVWNDAEHRFEPIRRGVVRDGIRARRSAIRREQVAARQADRRRVTIEAALDLYRAAKRPITWDEIANRVAGGSHPYAVGSGAIWLMKGAWFTRDFWGEWSASDKTARCYQAMKRDVEAAGVRFASQGNHSHSRRHARTDAA